MENQATHSRHLGRSVSQPEPRPSPSVHHSRRFDGASDTFPPAQISLPLTRAESWVELSSQPSSSSLSSVDNEIVTTGLQVGSPFQRRRRLHPTARSLSHQQPTVLRVASASSHEEEEEEDESDSDEDRVMTSSAENIHSSEKDASDGSDDESDDDDGDNATTLGRASDAPVFRPHPNAFSHPPAGPAQRRYSTSSAEHPHPHSSFRRSSYPHRQPRGHRGTPNFMSPSVREDNDAALRASLTTLLSCAAAARGLPKNKEETDAQRTVRTGVTPNNQPMELRFIPESALTGEDKQNEAEAGPSTARRQHPSSGTVSPKSKRSESAGRGPRPAKKKRTGASTTGADAEYALISPTLLSWVVSAGVVVLVSVVGFGAGYVIGREVGREEARGVLAASVSSGGVNDTTAAGGDVIRSSVGLRKLRWSAVGRSIVAQA
ncbi:hypothetical protein ISF_02872 [Cordyceps fumosorosea ARSEF 2679]|uniref:Uncharacterized protein n=1 Tax=Cordyceps fumosorosea (strain ARSEF 2679) TaxID=1081104 RepID=A0A162JIR0_CORFA|nr:hypothetical protein ISF_02872 [Cordyceps fumosorosea ARSEF 2679]OAA69602.1 hypothetical protein ISF_02872 [Cordyceps fumosorosea ARSEF 2679]